MNVVIVYSDFVYSSENSYYEKENHTFNFALLVYSN